MNLDSAVEAKSTRLRSQLRGAEASTAESPKPNRPDPKEDLRENSLEARSLKTNKLQ
jgi:hypothetical protein